MSTEEVEYWTNSMGEAPPPTGQILGAPPTGSHLEMQYIIIAILIGSLTAGGLMYSLFRMIQNVAFDPLTEEEKLQALYHVPTTELIDSSDGKCVVCRKDTRGKGREWQTTGVGGCGYLTCDECFSGYKPLANRCEICGQFYCYRRGRVTFIELMNEAEVDDENNNVDIDKRKRSDVRTETEDEEERKTGTRDENKDDGLRRRGVAPIAGDSRTSPY